MSNGNKRPQTAMTRTVTDATRARVLDLLEAGESLAAIAREAGVDRKTARAIRGTLEGQERVARGLDERARHTEAQRAARARAHQVICEAIERAAEVLRDELDGPDRAARLRAAESLLDRGGAPKSTKVDTTVRASVDLSKLSDDELDTLERLQAKAATDGAT